MQIEGGMGVGRERGRKGISKGGREGGIEGGYYKGREGGREGGREKEVITKRGREEWRVLQGYIDGWKD